jgi:hypothetical protein
VQIGDAMEARLRSGWQYTKKYWILAVIITAFVEIKGMIKQVGGTQYVLAR